MIEEVTNYAASNIGKLFTAGYNYRLLLQSKKIMLRTLCFETQSNIDLLDIIDRSKLSNLKVYSESIKSILNSMEIDVLGSIVFSDEKVYKKIYKQFNQQVDVLDAGDENKGKINKKKSPLQIIIFILEKVTLLQKLASYNGEGEDVLNKMLLDVRLDNIKNHLIALKMFLKDLDKEEDFLVK